MVETTEVPHDFGYNANNLVPNESATYLSPIFTFSFKYHASTQLAFFLIWTADSLVHLNYGLFMASL